ncbi:MAG: tetratricopeptide repeat protein [Thermodesulfobacteriota bacterium]
MDIRKAAVLFILVVATVSCAPTMRVDKKKDAGVHYDLGVIHLSERRFPDALKELTAAVEIDPSEPTHHNALGLAYFGKKMYSEAILSFEKAVALDGKFMEAHMNLGAAYTEIKEWDRAITEFHVVRDDIFYKTPELAHNNIGWALYNKREYKAAVRSYRKAVELNPEYSMAYNNMGMAYDKMEKYDEAEEALAIAVKISPLFVEAHYNHGLALIHKKDNKGARRAFQAVVNLAPQSDMGRSAKEYINLLK